MPTLANRIIQLRNEAGMSASDLAKSIGIKPSSLWAIENGKTKSLKSATLMRIAAVLDANPEFIRTGKGDRHKLQAANTVGASEIQEIFKTLTPQKRAALLATARALKG